MSEYQPPKRRNGPLECPDDVIHDIPQYIRIRQYAARQTEHLVIAHKIDEEVNADQNDEYDVAVPFKKAVNFSAPPVERLYDAPAVERRERDQVEHAERYRIQKKVQREHLEKILQSDDRNVDVI